MLQAKEVVGDPEDLRIHYRRPDNQVGINVRTIAKTDHAKWDTIAIEAGQESDVHYHAHSDAFWLVIEGALRFFDRDGEQIAECGANEGVVIPRGFSYGYHGMDRDGARIVEAYRFGASDIPLMDSEDDRRSVGVGTGRADVWTVRDGKHGFDEPQASPLAAPKKFCYIPPAGVLRKKVEILALTDRGVFGMQVLRSGGETNLHSHPHFDGFWFVRRGAARFYTTDDQLIGELGPNEGIIIRRNYPYWFEAVIKDPADECELLQMETADIPISGRVADLNSDRVDYTPRPQDFEASS